MRAPNIKIVSNRHKVFSGVSQIVTNSLKASNTFGTFNFRTMKKLITLALIASLGPACKKEARSKYPPLDHTEVRGVLRDASTLEPIANGIVKVYKGKCPGAFGIFGDFLEDTTDAEGRFEFVFTHHPDTCYEIVADADLYYGNENKGAGLTFPNGIRASGQDRIKKGFVNDEDIYLAPYGWLELRIVNMDKKYGTLSINGLDPYFVTSTLFSGFEVDTIVLTQQYGNYDNWFPLFVYNADTNFRLRVDTFWTPKHDTTYYEIKY